MPFMTYSTIIAVVTSLAVLARALPLSVRDVIDPPITSPTAGTVWTVGSTQTVTWDVTGLNLSAATNPNGMVVLGFSSNDSENLMLDTPLAQGFLLSDTKVQITVPDVPTRSDYIVVLFGDSGNASPEFTIQGSESTSDSVSPTSATTQSSDSDSATLSSTPVSSSTATQPASISSATALSAVAGSTSSTSSVDSSSVSSSISSVSSSQSSVLSSLSSAASRSASSASASQASVTATTSAASARNISHLTLLLLTLLTAVVIS